MAVDARPISLPVAVPAARPKARSILRELPIMPTAILGLLVFIALTAGILAPYDPTLPVAGTKIFQPPVWMEGGSDRALLGTDFQGRDILSRMLFGARISLLVGVVGTVVAGGIGMV